MNISVERFGTYVLLRTQGRIDAFNFQTLTDRIQTLKKAGKKHLIVDLTNTRTVSLNVARYLARTSAALKEQGGQLIFVTSSPRIQEAVGIFARDPVQMFPNFSEVESSGICAGA